MDYRSILSLAKWVAGALSYLIVNTVLSLAFVLMMMRLAYGNDDSPALGLVMLMDFSLVFPVGLFWGIIYLPAFRNKSGPVAFWSVWKCLGLSYLFGLLSYLPLYRIFSFPLPDFQSQLATTSFLILMFCLSILLFLAGLAVRFRLLFRSRQGHARGPRPDAENASLSHLDIRP